MLVVAPSLLLLAALASPVLASNGHGPRGPRGVGNRRHHHLKSRTVSTNADDCGVSPGTDGSGWQFKWCSWGSDTEENTPEVVSISMLASEPTTTSQEAAPTTTSAAAAPEETPSEAAPAQEESPVAAQPDWQPDEPVAAAAEAETSSSVPTAPPADYTYAYSDATTFSVAADPAPTTTSPVADPSPTYAPAAEPVTTSADIAPAAVEPADVTTVAAAAPPADTSAPEVTPEETDPAPPAQTTTVVQEAAPPAETTPAPIQAAVIQTNTPASSGSGGVSGDDQQRYFAAHNNFRAKYGASALTWSDEAAGKAAEWAQGCRGMVHSKGVLGSFGENLAAGTGDGYSIENAIKQWTDEAKDYNAQSPVFSHFTQVVWAGTAQVGCAMQDCPGLLGPVATYGTSKLVVCEYSKPGNVLGQFAENVGKLIGA